MVCRIVVALAWPMLAKARSTVKQAQASSVKTFKIAAQACKKIAENNE